MIAGVEVEHEKRYLALLASLEEGNVFKDERKIRWACRKCGYIFVGNEPPKVCPLCGHPQAYFQRDCRNY